MNNDFIFELLIRTGSPPYPKDDHVLELAVASGTKRIVTHTMKDFKGAEAFGIKPINPKEFMEKIS